VNAVQDYGPKSVEVDLKGCEMKLSYLANELFEEISEIPVIDAHEHLPSEAEYLQNQYSGLNMFAGGYVWHDLESAGLSSQFKATMRDPGHKPVDDWWPVVRPYWQHVLHSSYAKALRIAVRDLYGIADINDSTIYELAEHVIEDNSPGLYSRIFRDKCGIEATITNKGQAAYPDDPGLYGIMALFKPGDFTGNYVKAMEEKTGRELVDIGSLAEACQVLMREDLDQGALGFKFMAAHTASPNETVAVEEFQLAQKSEYRSQSDPTEYTALFSVSYPALRDYLLDKLLDVAAESDVPVAVHTGYWGDYRKLDPKHLLTFAGRRKDVRFDLFHLGMPMVRDAALIGKILPNVTLNLTWCVIISQVQTYRMLIELIDLVPANKIIAFGGDYVASAQEVYGHLYLARQTVAAALAFRIEQGDFDRDEALRLARLWFYENPRRIYGLDKLSDI
jgi:hypothetical protein